MILHYLKVAFRNLLAHKTQTLVSLLGLAMAFACVSLASYWNHYERTYDAFQTNADRVYRIRPISDNPSGLLGGLTPYILHLYLKENYPEVEKSCLINKQSIERRDNDDMHMVTVGSSVSINGVFYPEKVYQERLTEEAMDIFEMEIVKGNKDLMSYKWGQVAISEQLAHSLCGNNSPIGKILDIWQGFPSKDGKFEVEIMGVFKTRSKHSNLKFNVITAYHNRYENPQWGDIDGQTYVLLKQGVDHEKFIQKLQKDTIITPVSPTVFGMVTPLTELHYTYPDEEINVSLDDVTLFTNAAILLALCALLNYLTLFVSRLRARGRDMALRTICGSSGWQTIALLLTEYLLLLVVASLLGMLFVELVIRKFMELAMIEIPFSAVMISCGCLMLFSLVLSVVLSTFPILYFKRKTLLVQIEATPTRIGNNYFRSIGVCVQLIVGFLFLFCTTVMTKQIYMLTHTDNIERKKVAWVAANKEQHDLVQDVLRQQPFIKEILPVEPLFPKYHMTNNIVLECESTDAPDFRFATYGLNDEIAQFYGLKMKEGPASFELGRGEIFINEMMTKKLNIENPIGKTLVVNFKGNRAKIRGIVSDFQVQNPKQEPLPILYHRYLPNIHEYNGVIVKLDRHVAFKYEGEWETCRKKLEEELLERGVKDISFADGEKHYDYFLKSEYNLLKLLAIITIVSILIAVFGIYAMIMQSCDQHQKEIAIRKVYGAKVSDILLMFFKQSMMQVALAAVIAFPIGYFLMKNWLEQYARQTSISLWIYLFIFLAISFLVTLCIGWRVWKAANENPAWVIKKE